MLSSPASIGVAHGRRSARAFRVGLFHHRALKEMTMTWTVVPLIGEPMGFPAINNRCKRFDLHYRRCRSPHVMGKSWKPTRAASRITR